MASEHFQFSVKFPGNLEFIPTVRKYVSETLLANNFDQKFTYRSEIIVDEICNNAVRFGCMSVDAVIELLCTIGDDRIEFVISDEGGKREDVDRLAKRLKEESREAKRRKLEKHERLGLAIVRMLSDELHCKVAADNVTTVRVVKMRERDEQEDSESETEAS